MCLMNKKKLNLQKGMVKRHPDGFGFFIPEDPAAPDVYIPRHSMNGIMTNDRVEVEVIPEKGTDRFRGEIVKIIERGTRKVVGQFLPLRNGGGLLRDDGKGWGRDLKISNGQTMDAKEGELVAAEIISFPEESKDFAGKVIQVIGDKQDPLTDIERVIHTLNIPSQFSKGALQEASKLTNEVSEKDMRGRKDLRKLNFVTIDGATAKDFDDAIYIEQSRQGFRLFVAIADVSHYVRVGSAIDKDAYERGTSVYFPNFVVPMLPEILSNELCSLNPHRPRLALVAEMQMDFHGVVLESTFYEAVIESQARVTYGEAQEMIEGADIEKFKHVKADILRAADLAKILMAKRFQEGSLDLEIPETQLLIDAGGNPIDVIRSERLFAHRLIEEMMLAANVAVAKFLADKEVGALYRVHESPNPDAIILLEKYMRNFGSQVSLEGGKLQKRLTKALHDFEGKPEAHVLNILTLRSMSQAKYSSNNLGHFGLGFEFYAHFTSPIRRYPDLIIHRLIKSQVMTKSPYRVMSDEDLASAGTMLSACEQRAVKAERQIQGIKKARFMHKHLGEEFDGVVSSVTKFGVFVLLRQFEIDGLIHIDNLGPGKFEKFEFDEENLRLTAKRSGLSFSIGDTVKVRVVAADIDEGKVDFEMAERPSGRTKVHPSGKEKEPRSFAGGFSPPPPAGTEPFDPGKKLEEALRRRGLKPSSDLNQEGGADRRDRRGGKPDRRKQPDRRKKEEKSFKPDEKKKAGGSGPQPGNRKFGKRKKRR